MSVDCRIFDRLPDGREVKAYTITNDIISVEVIDFGATVRCLFVPDKHARMKDIVFGYDTVKPYINDGKYFGKTIGQCCNRIKNGEFTLNGKSYQLEKNENGKTCLHGADEYCNKLWQSEKLNDYAVKMSYISPDGEKGFPGNVKTEAIFSIDGNVFKIEYKAVSDKDTIINLTNHSYFNLNGYNHSDICNHIMSVCARKYLPTDENNVPTGEIESVENTPFDFRIAKPIGEAIESDFEQIKKCNGIDHNFCLRQKCRDMNVPAIILAEGKSGIKMSVYTDQTGIQIYTGNFLDGTGKNSSSISKYSGVAIEAQGYPDAINNPDFPQVIVKSGEEYSSTTKFVFETM
ncbi:MAG: galactose mutarotase [Clostridiales bacterium]|nr:galactose mutarotase [Clostridiales bacterium]